ncbi:hypothetical protein [Domibacillus aminovorans]|uniref:hypothetical protein n=1 Tax=Domibacillus aminovorans TaxID=29332 RepID=UPI0018DF9E53|nr:hypothetical protein [Domibacillus aminovorans]
MNRHEVYRILKAHYDRTGKVMSAGEVIDACGSTDPAELMFGRRMLDKDLDLQRGGAA